MAFPFWLAGALDRSALCAKGSVRLASSTHFHTIFCRPADGAESASGFGGRTIMDWSRRLHFWLSIRCPRRNGGRAIRSKRSPAVSRFIGS